MHSLLAYSYSPAASTCRYVKHDFYSDKNIMNGLLAAVTLIPSFITTHYLYTECDTSAPPSYETAEVAACAIAIHEPVWFANALFFVNVTVGFWAIGTFVV